MKRSEINKTINRAQGLFEKENITLPPFAYWGYDEWVKNKDRHFIINTALKIEPI